MSSSAHDPETQPSTQRSTPPSPDAPDTTAPDFTATPQTSAPEAKPKDPLRGSRTSGAWVAVLALVVLLVLLAIFILQNTQSVEVSFLGWSGSAPLSASLLIATVAGLVLAVSAGALRILQLRRRVKRARKA